MRASRLLLFVLTITTLLLSACGGTPATPNPGGGKVEPIPVAFVGTVESIADDQWMINGQTVTVAPDVIQDGPFNIGDQVKVEGFVNSDGSFTISRIEVPTPQDASTLPQFGNENSSDSNTNNAIINDANGNEANANSNDDNSNGLNSNDDNSNGANTNDANVNDANSNEDNSNSANTNDDNENDNNGSNDNSDDSNSNDDNGGGSDDDDDNSND